LKTAHWSFGSTSRFRSAVDDGGNSVVDPWRSIEGCAGMLRFESSANCGRFRAGRVRNFDDKTFGFGFSQSNENGHPKKSELVSY
jgi:hypothetical protein